MTDFVYWFDEPGDREMWFRTENHVRYDLATDGDELVCGLEPR